MNILIYSHPPFAGTGFGTVVNALANHLKKDHNVYIACVAAHYGLPIEHNGCVILTCPGPVAQTWKWAAKWAKNLSIDVVIQHFDVWMLPAGWVEKMPCPVITYAPVDCYPLPDNFEASCIGATMNVAMTRYAQGLFEEARMPSLYIPHGVDTTVFKRDAQARQKLGIPKETFVVGIVATNGSLRKNLGGQMQAFASFAKDKDDVMLYMHTQAKKTHLEALDLPYLATKLGIENKVVFTDPEAMALGIPQEFLPTVYSAFDVMMQCSLGEGFGLPIIEAQACGTPVIGTTHPVIMEVMGGGGSYVVTDTLFMNYYMSNIYVPDEEDMVDELERFYAHRNLFTDDALENAQQYDWQRIFPLWDDLLSKLF